MQKRTLAFQKRFPNDWRAQELRAYAAVAAQDPDAAAALLQPLAARLGEHIEVDRLQLWLAAMQGDHAAAYRIAARLGRKRYILGEDARGLDLRPLNRAPKPAEWRQRHDRILLFANFRNERLFAPWFLDYYRQLGVERFFIVDNLSDDGTADYLAAQKDVTAFSSRDHYGRAQSGIRWTNELIRRYGDDNWCVLVDADEELILPAPSFPRKRESSGKRGSVDGSLDSRLRGNNGSSASPLRNFVDGMAARGEETLPAYMLDTFPADMAAVKDFQPGDAPLAVSNLIDADYFFSGTRFCPFLRVRGGARQRLFGIRERLEKAPILRGGIFPPDPTPPDSAPPDPGAPDPGPQSTPPPGETRRLYADIHTLNYARPSPRIGALLHHKLLREALSMQGAMRQNPAHRTDTRIPACQQRHAAYRTSGYLSPTAEIPRTPATVPYKTPAQLHHLGLLGEPNPADASRTIIASRALRE